MDTKTYHRQYYLENCERLREYSRQYNLGHWVDRSAYLRQYRFAFKKKALTHYGNGKLACLRCGFLDIRALSIDHINGLGHQHRKAVGHGNNFYRWLIKEGYPNGYQTLCMNCQFIKKAENKEQQVLQYLYKP